MKKTLFQFVPDNFFGSNYVIHLKCSEIVDALLWEIGN